MGQLTTGVGLISGLPIADLVDQLMALEARPKQLITQRNTVLTSQQVAFQDISAKLLVLKLTAGNLAKTTTFSATTVASSNEAVATATSSAGTAPGSYRFTVDRLVTSQQMITRGFRDQNTTPVGEGTLTFEFGDARLDTDTDLRRLNGGQGVPRGRIQITDRSGASATVDLSKALTVNDALNAINNTAGVNVLASVQGDRFVLRDTTGSTLQNLSVSDLGAGSTAAALGLAGSVAGATLEGGQVNTVGRDTLLGDLNDGAGVRTLSGQDDFQVTRRDGTTFNVNLASATTLGEVIDAIAAASGGNVTAEISAQGTGLRLVDATAGGSATAVAALNGSAAAADLGLLGSDADGDGIHEGGRLVAALNSKLLGSLDGGSGVAGGQIQITNRAGVATAIDLTSARSVSEVIEQINSAAAGVTAGLNSAGNGLQLTDTTGGSGDLEVADLGGTLAAGLGLAGTFAQSRVDGGNLQVRYLSETTRLDSLRGGLGITRGRFTLTDSAGASATVDLTQGDEVTLGDVIREVNSRGLAVNARINDTGDGLLIEDLGPGIVKLKVAEAGSSTAADLGILGEAAELGQAIDGSYERTITVEAADTLDDLAKKIDNAGLAVRATIINDGSGVSPFRLTLTAREGGKAGAFVFDDGGLGLGASTLSEARNALVFYGSDDPARAVPISAASNKLPSIIPGATISLHSTSDQPVEINVSRDEEAIVAAVKKFVTDFNSVIDTLDKYDTYDQEKEERGLLLGDSTVGQVRSALYRQINGRNSAVQGQYTAAVQLGIRVGSGAKLELNEDRLRAALANNRAAVTEFFAFKEEQTDEETGETTVTGRGFGLFYDHLLDSLTRAEGGVVTRRLDGLEAQVALNEDRIEKMDELLAMRRARLESQFLAMEQALGQMQGQSSALAGLQTLAANARASTARP